MVDMKVKKEWNWQQQAEVQPDFEEERPAGDALTGDSGECHGWIFDTAVVSTNVSCLSRLLCI